MNRTFDNNGKDNGGLVRTPAPLSLEEIRLISDLCKHLTTLSSGLIIILVSFLKTITENADWKLFIPISFLAFIVSLLLSVATQGLISEMVLAKAVPLLKKSNRLLGWELC